MTDPVKDGGFPHSEISGSKVANHLPEAYRRYATSFIATSSLGIHRTPLDLLLGNLKTAFLFFACDALLEFNFFSKQDFFYPIKVPVVTNNFIGIFTCPSPQQQKTHCVVV